MSGEGRTCTHNQKQAKTRRPLQQTDGVCVCVCACVCVAVVVGRIVFGHNVNSSIR